MSDDGSTKDDVKVPTGDAGDKINKLFTDEGKDVSKSIIRLILRVRIIANNHFTDVIVLTAMGEEVAIDAKEAPKG